jgi:hypothetical protein
MSISASDAPARAHIDIKALRDQALAGPAGAKYRDRERREQVARDGAWEKPSSSRR